MWIFGQHRHINPDTLSEYLDDRLSLRDKGRVDRAIAACAYCQGELDSRRVTLSLLRELPSIPPPRSFTLPAPPLAEPSPAAGPATSRLAALPTWAYAGAATMAAIALALLLLVDGAGLTTPQNDFTDQEAIAAIPQAEPASPAAQAQPAAATEAMAAPAAMAEPQPKQTQPKLAKPTPASATQMTAAIPAREAVSESETIQVPVEVTSESASVETSEPAGLSDTDSISADRPAAPTVADSVSAPAPAAASAPSEPAATATPQTAQTEAAAAAPQSRAGPTGYANGVTRTQGDTGQLDSSGELPSTPTPIPTPTATPLPTLTPTPTAAPPTATPTPPLDTATANGAAGSTMPPPTTIEQPAMSEPAAGSKITLRLLQGIAAALTVALLIALILKLRRDRRPAL